MSNSNDIYNIIGRNIKKYRKLKGWTQRELAERLLLSDSFIGKLESVTHQTISIDTLEQMSKYELGKKILHTLLQKQERVTSC